LLSAVAVSLTALRAVARRDARSSRSPDAFDKAAVLCAACVEQLSGRARHIELAYQRPTLLSIGGIGKIAV
jgi:hypothetical protein